MGDLDKYLSQIRKRAGGHRSVQREGASQPDNEARLEVEEEVPTELAETLRTGPRAEETLSTADIAIIAALPTPELEQALAAFGSEWQPQGREGVLYYVTTDESQVAWTLVFLGARLGLGAGD